MLGAAVAACSLSLDGYTGGTDGADGGSEASTTDAPAVDTSAPPLREALTAHCTVGELCGVLRDEFGTHDR